jgi:hypothetical protein
MRPASGDVRSEVVHAGAVCVVVLVLVLPGMQL